MLEEEDSADEEFWNQEFFAEDKADDEYKTESSSEDEADTDFSEEVRSVVMKPKPEGLCAQLGYHICSWSCLQEEEDDDDEENEVEEKKRCDALSAMLCVSLGCYEQQLELLPKTLLPWSIGLRSKPELIRSILF